MTCQPVVIAVAAIPSLICLKDRKWCSVIGSLLANQVAIGSIRFDPKLGLCFLKG